MFVFAFELVFRDFSVADCRDFLVTEENGDLFDVFLALGDLPLFEKVDLDARLAQLFRKNVETLMYDFQFFPFRCKGAEFLECSVKPDRSGEK